MKKLIIILILAVSLSNCTTVEYRSTPILIPERNTAEDFLFTCVDGSVSRETKIGVRLWVEAIEQDYEALLEQVIANNEAAK